MRRNLTLVSTTRPAPVRGGTPLTAMQQALPLTADGETTPLVEIPPRVPRARAWWHTVVLVGTLNWRTVPDLEDEIKCLCDEGVTGITLDLREVSLVDPTAVRFIASASVRERSRGRDFAVIPSPGPVRWALFDTGAVDLLAGDSGAGRGDGRQLTGSSVYRSTRTVKHL
jgi:anti-anti-sigma regulatory factor